MYCCGQCQGLEEIFNQESVRKELARYRKKGPARTTRLLLEAVQKVAARGMTLLDIGGGVGAIEHTLLSDGVARATSVDASSAYIAANQSEAQRRGLAGRVDYQHGDFVDLAPHIQPADIVTLDRVICCYHDMENLVDLSAQRAKKVYAVVYPRDRWFVKLAMRLMNFFLRLQKSPYRAFVHPTQEVNSILERNGFLKHFYTQTFVWQVVVYTR
jgi:magnesium-protoporphyrin O-methyltransferase